MRPDTVAFGGKPRGDRLKPQDAALGESRIYVHEHRHGREVSASTCSVAGTVRCPPDAWATAEAIESCAEAQLDFCRLSRLDLATDIETLPRDVVRGMASTALDRDLPCWFYWTARRKGITLFPDGLDRLRVYDKGLESGTMPSGVVWRVEAQMRRGQLDGLATVRDARRLTRRVHAIARDAVYALL